MSVGILIEVSDCFGFCKTTTLEVMKTGLDCRINTLDASVEQNLDTRGLVSLLEKRIEPK